MIDLGDPLERGGVLDEVAHLVKPPDRRRGYGGHGQTQRAGAGDDEHGNGDVERVTRVARGQHPARKGAKRQQVDEGRINARGLVGKRGIGVAPGLGGFDKRRDPAQRGVFSDGGGGQVERRAEVDFAGMDSVRAGQVCGGAFARQERAVEAGRV